MKAKMCSSFFHFLLIISLVVISLSTVGATGNHREQQSWAVAKPGCQGSIAECMGEGELETDSEINSRRKLYSYNYICYNALAYDYTPCSVRGLSYYNCYEDAEANPYSRGCSYITQCRSDYVSDDYLPRQQGPLRRQILRVNSYAQIMNSTVRFILPLFYYSR
ncbi:hypothetical protein Vadar_001907 [Vaccinium darrowii]|uniref:Uncharacterized protein n=1 Tax=Vaccinium darrowii TaxID=229202 RepID=A0ACB7Z8J4_9ERIC|nr:hypothetical protein Vadar_001907 [Vaccinium darrowii]